MEFMGGFSTAASRARAWMVELADRLFGCRHRKTTMPMTLRPDEAGSGADGGANLGTYIVCLECGRRLAYDMNGLGAGGRRAGFLGLRRAGKSEAAAGREARR
jgi:hypothetical protein